jgi:4-alpha-glucanotransferase
MRFSRSAGILLHPTSFPGRYGIGDLGDAAYNFVDFLVASKQSLWQILPLGPTGYGDSPYQCFSAFAGNPLLISPDRLVADGYLPGEALREIPNFPAHKVDFGPVIAYKTALYRQAHTHFQANGTAVQRAAYDQFCADNAAWLDDFALFMAVKNHHVEQEGGVWNSWPRPIAQRQPKAMAEWSTKLAGEIALYRFLQFLFFEQWLSLKGYANEKGIKIWGTCRFSSPLTAPTSGPTPICFTWTKRVRRRSWRAYRRTISAKRASAGATRFTAGTKWRSKLQMVGRPAGDDLPAGRCCAH